MTPTRLTKKSRRAKEKAASVTQMVPVLLDQLKERGEVIGIAGHVNVQGTQRADVLVDVMQQLGLKLHSDSPSYQAIGPRVRLQCMKLQMPTTLVAVMADFQANANVQAEASHLLKLLAVDDESRDSIVAAGCLDSITRFVASISPVDIDGPVAMGVVEAMTAVNNIVIGSDSTARKDAAVGAGIIDAIVRVFTVHAVGQPLDIPANAMITLGYLSHGAGDSERAAQITNAGVAEAVAVFLQRSDAPAFMPAIAHAKQQAGPMGMMQTDFLAVIATNEHLLKKAMGAGMPLIPGLERLCNPALSFRYQASGGTYRTNVAEHGSDLWHGRATTP
jgi:hypothetical protein